MSNTTGEKLLLKQLQDGLEKAYHALFMQYSTALTLFAVKILKDEALAMDVVQNVFLKLFEERESLQIHTSLRSFLFQSVRNRCLNELKSGQIKARHHQQMSFSTADFTPEIQLQMEAAELESSMAKVVSELPVQCKRIFEMSRLEGKSNAEIAEELHLSKRTVETQISKALKQLRQKLAYWLIQVGWILLGLGIP